MRQLNRRGGALGWLLLTLTVVAGFGWYYGMGPGGAGPGERDRRDPARGNKVEMKDVEIEAFDERFHRTTLLKGDTATTYKDSSELVLEPATGTLFREPGKDVFVKARQAHKFTGRQGERFEFTGSVEVTSEKRQLVSEKLLYSPASRLLESGAPVRIHTTGSILLADRLKSQTDLRTGVLEGSVKIRTFGEGGRSFENPVKIDGNRSDFDLTRGLFNMAGMAWAQKEDSKVEADKIAFNRRRKMLTADGHSVLTRPDLVLSAGHLEYWVDREAGIATNGPKAVQNTPGTTNETESRTQLTAAELEGDFKKGVLEGRGAVRLQRYVKFEGDWEPDYAIDAHHVTHLYKDRRALFKGNVKIEAEKVGAVGDRAVFYQQRGKLYIVGRAEAWDYDELHTKKNHISGEKIVHDLKTGKSQVIGRVKSGFSEEPGGRGQQPHRQPRPGRSEIIFQEGGGQ
ncbi:MAG: LPS export ABC transporter periplasmic protein LptC [Candidatus Riflebacteria bacterium]|nr:LPS export ABC transporter periplasmic protein LptC [Candidatus Riflebacteria bacterium]